MSINRKIALSGNNQMPDITPIRKLEVYLEPEQLEKLEKLVKAAKSFGGIPADGKPWRA